MTDTINLQELYEAGNLNHGDEFITRGGRSAWFIGKRIIDNSDYPFVFQVEEGIHTYTNDGLFHAFSDNDMMNIVRRAPKKKTVYANVYKHDIFINIHVPYDTKEEADRNAGTNRIGVLSGEIEVEDD